MMPAPRQFDLLVKPCECGLPKAKLPSGTHVCRPCRADYERERYHSDDDAKKKMLARAAAKDALKRGTLSRLPCEICGDPKSEMHHWDYDKPYDVTFFCKTHHAEIEGAKRTVKRRETVALIAGVDQ